MKNVYNIPIYSKKLHNTRQRPRQTINQSIKGLNFTTFSGFFSIIIQNRQMYRHSCQLSVHDDIIYVYFTFLFIFTERRTNTFSFLKKNKVLSDGFKVQRYFLLQVISEAKKTVLKLSLTHDYDVILLPSLFSIISKTRSNFEI